MILRGRVVLPITQPPIRDGAVLVYGNRIARVGRWKDLRGDARDEVIDLGDSILLPGLVNAHCHLDYTDMAGLIPPQKSFTDWIQLMLSAKAGWNYSEFAASWLAGAQMLMRSGTTTVADFEAVPELLPDVWTATPLRVLSFLEMTGVKSRRNPHAVLEEAVTRLDLLSNERSCASLAPHAPYSTLPELLQSSAEFTRQRKLLLAIHVAESLQEFDMFTRRSGAMFDWLKRNQRDLSDCGLGSPIQHLERNRALGENVLAVHVNYLGEKDAALLKRKKVSVVHCPRSHAYFQHGAFPYNALSRARINICLGTDSLATVKRGRREHIELNMFEEMRAFAMANPGVSAKNILQMATVNGARALGRSGQIGEISTGAFADVVAMPFSGTLRSIHETVMNLRAPVTASLIDGRWAVPP